MTVYFYQFVINNGSEKIKTSFNKIRLQTAVTLTMETDKTWPFYLFTLGAHLDKFQHQKFNFIVKIFY